jgi:hypothetical protein
VYGHSSTRIHIKVSMIHGVMKWSLKSSHTLASLSHCISYIVSLCTSTQSNTYRYVCSYPYVYINGVLICIRCYMLCTLIILSWYSWRVMLYAPVCHCNELMCYMAVSVLLCCEVLLEIFMPSTQVLSISFNDT